LPVVRLCGDHTTQKWPHI